MTRVAVVEPFPRVSGVTTYAWHLAEGLRRAGADVDTVSFVANGSRKTTVGGQSAVVDGKYKSGWQWSPLVPTRVAKWRDAVSVFDEYDLVFINEPRCAPLDKKAMRKIGGGDIKAGREAVRNFDIEYADLPEYVRALSESKTPWASCMHDPGYGFKLAPFLPQLLEVAPPAVIVTHRPGSIESAEWAMGEGTEGLRHLRIPNLPFAFEPLPRDEWPKVAGMLGRYINNKGQPTLMSVALYGEMPDGWSVRVAGSSPLGAGPNHTFLTYEAFLKAGLEGEREGNGNVTTGEPWRVYRDGTLAAEFAGPYDSGAEASLRHGLHVNATEVAFSGAGEPEYADLEAMSAGALPVLPDHRDVEALYAAVRYELLKCANAEMSSWDELRVRTRGQLAEAISQGADVLSDARERNRWLSWNVDVMREVNSSEGYASAVLEGALGGAVSAADTPSAGALQGAGI